MKKVWIIAMAMGALVGNGGCLASHKYVKNQVKTTTDQLSTEVNGRIDTTNGRVETLDGNIKETRDSVDIVNKRVAGVDERVSKVDTRVSDVDGRVTTVDGKVTTVDNKVATVDQRVATLDTRTNQQLNSIKQDVSSVDVKTDKTMKNLDLLDEKFGSRNNMTVHSEHMIQFGFDSAKLDKEGASRLDEVAAALMSNRDAILVLEGRTDSTGDREYNVALGERRVEQVRRYLAVDKNIPVYRIHEISLGAARPVASNDSAEGRKQNRSVTISVLVPSANAAVADNQVGQTK